MPTARWTALVLALLMVSCSAESTTLVSVQQPEVPTAVEVPPAGQTPTPASATAQPAPTPTTTPAPTATPRSEPTQTPGLIPDRSAVLASQSTTFVSVDDWCSGSGPGIRDAMIAVDRSVTFEPWPDLVEALWVGVSDAPPEHAVSVADALFTFEEVFLVFVSDVRRGGHDVTFTVASDDGAMRVQVDGVIPEVALNDVTIEFMTANRAFTEAFYDIDEYNLAVCGLEPARRPRPEPTPTPEPSPTPTAFATPDAEDIETAVDNLRDIGLAESESLCLLEAFLDPDFVLEDAVVAGRILEDCLSDRLEAALTEMGFDPAESSCILDGLLKPGVDWGDTEANQAAIRLCVPDWTGELPSS